MAFETFMLAGGVAVLLGMVAARMMRVLGLALLLGVIIALGILRVALLLPQPSLLGFLMLLALVQAGYLFGVLAFGEAKAEPAQDMPRRAVRRRGLGKDDTPAH